MDNEGLKKTNKKPKFQIINTWLNTQHIKNLES